MTMRMNQLTIDPKPRLAAKSPCRMASCPLKEGPKKSGIKPKFITRSEGACQGILEHPGRNRRAGEKNAAPTQGRGGGAEQRSRPAPRDASSRGARRRRF